MRACTTEAAGAGRLLPAGCGQERGAEPVGTRLFCLADNRLDFLEFVRAKPHSDKFSQSLALGFLWSANFLSHAKIVSVTRKFFLHEDNLCVTDIQVSNETLLSSEQVAGTAAGESELTNSLPVRAGASRRESEMKADTNQVRSLKIEAAGDFFRGKIMPKIRLNGQWLERAGFKPGHRVEVRFDQPGNLRLRFLEQAKEGAL